ncbi:ATP-dependent zinc metalloprotease FtsH [Defluviitalea raffinosedens]|jgi:cell division protease FtsH|uniref:ATP-dependent zinc metalloprotease FtsH n=1 Tax=Defluviitalea raffinosedens TaxID=1450156 RepID=A0A7C8LEC2_9FIRM|nr:ATP-dependent zinc metalloprotease FtsH [Defluviitalea raffinosedens]
MGLKKYFKGLSLYMLIFIIIILAVIFTTNSIPNSPENQVTYDQLIKNLQNEEVKRLDIYPDADSRGAEVKATLKNGDLVVISVPSVDHFMERIEQFEENTQIVTYSVSRPNWFIQLLPSLVIMVLVVILLIFIMQQVQGGGGGSRVMSFGKSRAKMVVDDKKKVTFNNVAGLDEEKEELKEIVDFLKQPRKYVELGARIPKGVLLVGPPGTGKTLLAKAVAGEAGVPFFSISGSDFVEMFVGVGASRVRDLFEQAKKNSPCIVFIDEIDAVGRRRGAGLGGGHDEREQTLNQLLVEMDGFGVNEGVIVIAATNRADILDPALLRPGRFDRRVVVGRPDVKGREEILKVHAKGKPLEEDVDLKVVAQTTAGFTGADLENLLNEAALLSARESKRAINMETIQKAFVKVGIGTEKKSRVISEKEKKITAYHEAGHAIIHQVLTELDPVHSISIIPTGMAGGYTMPLPGEDKMYMTKKRMEQEIISLLGGRAAEKIILDDITTGASNDIERATAIARNMVTKYGMSSLGPIQFGDDNDEVFIGRDLAHTRNYGEAVAGAIDREIRAIIEHAYEEAQAILRNHIDILHKTAQLLMEKEKISGKEFAELFNKVEEKEEKSETSQSETETSKEEISEISSENTTV